MLNQHGIPDQEIWRPWNPAQLSRRLCRISRPWCIVGGWAIDLWYGRKTREHEDLEFTILRRDFSRFRRELSEMEFYTVQNGVLALLADNEDPQMDTFQVWCFERAASCWRADIMFEPGNDDYWVYKRDTTITRPRNEMVALSTDGIPYLSPSAVLLFKAKYRRPKDQKDFELATKGLVPAERLWLRECLERLHPGHLWASKL